MHLGAVEHLYISACDDLRYLWEQESEACKSLVRLRELEVWYCNKLVASAEKEDNFGISMESLKICGRRKGINGRETNQLNVHQDGAPPRIIPIVALIPIKVKGQLKPELPQKANRYNNVKRDGKVFSFDLLDSDGGEIRGTCFNVVADNFHNQIEGRFREQGNHNEPASRKDSPRDKTTFKEMKEPSRYSID
ncbi:hypothetical protein L2E82_30103 [Cichorium intybus]|uniref:Uncharacterized protein n=1 Tax=Cichorium intybus TaxID=13427 RepID=A0ACB9D043_CICIN|nr:hypothetical protein L2E82_30103 [Cichorium intybus]